MQVARDCEDLDYTAPYHPQSDRMIERFNRTLLSMLQMATIDTKRDWDHVS